MIVLILVVIYYYQQDELIFVKLFFISQNFVIKLFIFATIL